MEDSRIDVEQGMGDTVELRRSRPRTRTSTATTTGRAKGVKRDERGHHMTGRVVRILHGQSHGFIRAEDDRQLFFHRRDVRDALFNALAVGDPVRFEAIEDKIAGPRAVKVRRAAGKKRER